jgi:hypothetical protein
MEEQAQQLARLVSTFRLSNDYSSSERAALPSPTRAPAAAPRKAAPAPALRKASKALPAKASKGGDEEWEEF